jgi:tetratricopeptide (TPR) repeat protein
MSKKVTHQDPEESMENALNATEQFIEKNKNILIYSVIAVIAIAAAAFAYQHLYRNPVKQEALAQMFVAEQYFRADSFAKALKGDGNALGFNQIIEEYGSAAPESIYLYAGISDLHIGNFQAAIDNLKKYKTKDEIMQARAYSNIGDAYAGLSDLKEALKYYQRAADHSDNIFAATYLMKAAIILEETGEFEEALDRYEEIKVKYPQSQEGSEVDKYIARIKVQQ